MCILVWCIWFLVWCAPLCVHMCVCMYVCMYECMYVYVYICPVCLSFQMGLCLHYHQLNHQKQRKMMTWMFQKYSHMMSTGLLTSHKHHVLPSSHLWNPSNEEWWRNSPFLLWSPIPKERKIWRLSALIQMMIWGTLLSKRNRIMKLLSLIMMPMMSSPLQHHGKTLPTLLGKKTSKKYVRSSCYQVTMTILNHLQKKCLSLWKNFSPHLTASFKGMSQQKVICNITCILSTLLKSRHCRKFCFWLPPAGFDPNEWDWNNNSWKLCVSAECTEHKHWCTSWPNYETASCWEWRDTWRQRRLIQSTHTTSQSCYISTKCLKIQSTECLNPEWWHVSFFNWYYMIQGKHNSSMLHVY